MTGTFHIAVCMKPLEGNFVENALKHGVAGLNIDGCRIGTVDAVVKRGGFIRNLTIGTHSGYKRPNASSYTDKPKERSGPANVQGRWPANVIHDGSDGVLAGFPMTRV